MRTILITIILAYRQIPDRTRSCWNPAGTSNSHLALAALRAAPSGRAALRSFWHYAVPSVKEGIPWWLDD